MENFDYSLPGACFVTVCTHGRENILSNVGAIIDRPPEIILSPYGKIVEDAINNISKTYPALSVENYVIMPNHIHLLLFIHADENGRPMVAPTVSRIVQQMKGYVTKRIGRSIWQKSFHDHVIRGGDDYVEHQKYILDNPMKWQFDELYVD